MSDLARPNGRITPLFVAAVVRARLRRWQAARWFVAIVAATTLTSLVNDARGDATQAQAQWGEVDTVWITTRPIEAGETLNPGDAVEREIPSAAIPHDAVRTDPAGLQLRVEVGAPEILRVARLDPFGGGEVAARLPERSLAITLTVDDDIFAIDDRVDLYALSTGRVLSTGGSIVATNDHRATIAIGRTEMSAVVAELSRGGVAVVLSR